MTDIGTIKFKRLHELAKLPVYATNASNGADVFACINKAIAIRPGETVLVPTGFAMELPQGYGAQLLPRSGLGHKHGIVLGNLVGLVDSDYRGEVFISLWNRTPAKVFPSQDDQAYFVINPGDRIAQMIISKMPQFNFVWDDELSETVRGAGGIGHTGI